MESIRDKDGTPGISTSTGMEDPRNGKKTLTEKVDLLFSMITKISLYKQMYTGFDIKTSGTEGGLNNIIGKYFINK